MILIGINDLREFIYNKQHMKLETNKKRFSIREIKYVNMLKG